MYKDFNQFELNLFLKEDALRIKDFLEKKDYKNKNILCQCEFGKFRSVATATLLSEILFSTHTANFEKRNSFNTRVYNLLNLTLGQR